MYRNHSEGLTHYPVCPGLKSPINASPEAISAVNAIVDDILNKLEIEYKNIKCHTCNDRGYHSMPFSPHRRLYLIERESYRFVYVKCQHGCIPEEG